MFVGTFNHNFNINLNLNNGKFAVIRPLTWSEEDAGLAPIQISWMDALDMVGDGYADPSECRKYRDNLKSDMVAVATMPSGIDIAVMYAVNSRGGRDTTYWLRNESENIWVQMTEAEFCLCHLSNGL